MEWLWKSNSDPWSTTQKEEWITFSDVEQEMIEEAYQNKDNELLLDDYHINFKRMVQISNTNEQKQRPIKRMIRERQERVCLRSDRFTANLILPSRAYSGALVALFINSVNDIFNVNRLDIRADNSIRHTMVEKAADGLIVEGKLASKKREGEWMSKQLIKVKNGTIEEIWPVIAHLYSMNSFLYKKMNEWMRLTEEKEHAQLVQSKILTFGPFAYLLQIISPHDRRSMIVYRGAKLSDEMIQQYKTIAGTDQRFQFSWKEQIELYSEHRKTSTNHDFSES